MHTLNQNDNDLSSIFDGGATTSFLRL